MLIKPTRFTLDVVVNVPHVHGHGFAVQLLIGVPDDGEILQTQRCRLEDAADGHPSRRVSILDEVVEIVIGPGVHLWKHLILAAAGKVHNVHLVANQPQRAKVDLGGLKDEALTRPNKVLIRLGIGTRVSVPVILDPATQFLMQPYRLHVLHVLGPGRLLTHPVVHVEAGFQPSGIWIAADAAWHGSESQTPAQLSSRVCWCVRLPIGEGDSPLRVAGCDD